MKKKAFSLMEMMLVVVILGALIGIALPRLMKVMELRRVEVAKRQIELIEGAIDFAGTNNRGYIFCAPSCDDTVTINAALELDIHNPDFKFKVFTDITAPSGGYESIHAERQNGTYDYTLLLESDNPDIFICTGASSAGCDFIGMTYTP